MTACQQYAIVIVSVQQLFSGLYTPFPTEIDEQQHGGIFNTVTNKLKVVGSSNIKYLIYLLDLKVLHYMITVYPPACTCIPRFQCAAGLQSYKIKSGYAYIIELIDSISRDGPTPHNM